MKRRFFVLSGAALVSALAAYAQTGSPKLIVQVSYTGSGKVDESHKIYVALWDNPDFTNALHGDTELDPQNRRVR
jgi:hypothetical protein